MAVRLMRVTGGRYRGMRIRAPRGPGTRPATGRVRESVFSALGPAVVGARVVDLYAGSGSLGIEALSRGAGSALFVERSRPALAALRSNLRTVGVADRAVVAPRNVERFLADEQGGGRFDIVFADPPWDISSERLAGILARVARGWRRAPWQWSPAGRVTMFRWSTDWRSPISAVTVMPKLSDIARSEG